MVMYTHQFGLRSGGLTVLLANDQIFPVWERGGALGDVWVKAEVDLVSSSVFQVSAAPPLYHISPPFCQTDSSPSDVIRLDHPSTWCFCSQIVIMAAIRDSEYGGIAVDSIMLSPECQLSSGETLRHHLHIGKMSV